jgi:NADPH:quinone reductase-like Zn-dependent oxidoreductase
MTSHTGILEALKIILSGRTITADEAHRIGLVEEVATETDSLSRATELARAFITHTDDTLKEAFDTRRGQSSAWNEPALVDMDAVLAHPEIKRLLHQLNSSGREDAARKILEAVKYGYQHGLMKGLEHEAELFAQAVIDPKGGKRGIKNFLDKKAEPLPTRTPLASTLAEHGQSEASLLASGDLLPLDAAFYPAITPIPKYQYAFACVRSDVTGEALHGDPIHAEKKHIVPVEDPKPNEVLIYMLVSEVNFNDIWAITGIPVSQFDNVDRDAFITGSGGTGLIAKVGSEVARAGRLKVGDLVTVYSGQSDLQSPVAGLDPMFADFKIQGYETGDGSHQQFMLAQAPQCHKKPQDLTLEAAGSYILNLGTVFRALFTTLGITGGKRIFIEGAATGTGLECLKTTIRAGLHATGMVSSHERAAFIKRLGATGVIDRKDKRFAHIFTKVPEKKADWKKWEKQGEPLLKEFKKQNGDKLASYVTSHAGELSFPRSFQLLEKGGTLTFFGASSGYHFTFMGKAGRATPDHMLTHTGVKANEAILIYYGTATDKTKVVDNTGLEIIEAAREKGTRIVVACYTDVQKEFVQSLGFGDAIKGVISIQDIKRKEGDDFEWPETMKALPDPKHETEKFKEAVREFNDKVFKPFGAEVGKLFRSPDNPRGYPDVVFERAGHDTLSVSSTIVKPFTGRVIYAEDMASRRYSFYAPQVWMRQRRIYMPTANIFGTHLSNAYEVVQMNDMVEAGLLDVSEPYVVDFEALPTAHQEMWENKHKAGNYVCNHALPRLGLKTKQDLLEAWSLKK